MASDLGDTPILVEFVRNDPAGFTRAIWFVRWVMYAINIPCILLMVLLISGLALSDLITTLFMGEVWVICFLIGSLVTSDYKWAFFVFGVCAEIYVLASIFVSGRASAGRVGNDIGAHVMRGGGSFAFLWSLYPIAWGVSEGGNVINSTGEMIFYGSKSLSDTVSRDPQLTDCAFSP
jgi:bacteriorhodopsin